MRRWRDELFRILVVVALGAGLGALASGPERPKIMAQPRPAPIILATAMDADPPPQCLLLRRDKGDERPIGEKTGEGKAGHRNQKKVIACG